MAASRPILLILGPTAGGKTSLAINLAQRLPDGGECISADSMLVYRGMDIGTAKPRADERQGVPHHLIDLIDPSDDGFSVDQWLRLAEHIIHEIRQRHRWPIVVGGTNLYVKALLYGLMDGPKPNEDLRARLRAMDRSALRARFEQVDPVAAQRIHANDSKRMIRAIEFFEQTGVPISERQLEWETTPAREDVWILGLHFPPDMINKRINERVRMMFETGFLEEARQLWESRSLGRQARQALGYKQLIEHFEGRFTLDQAVEKIKIATSRYAKNQRTWLKQFHNLPSCAWLNCEPADAQDIANKAFTAICSDFDIPAPQSPMRDIDSTE